jgi:ketosteroid isomerase-like protein
MGLSPHAEALVSAYQTRDLTALADLLHEDVFWGDPAFPDAPRACHSRSEVLAQYRLLMGTGTGVRATIVDVVQSDTAVALGLSVEWPPESHRETPDVRYQVFTFRGGRISQIVGADDRRAVVEMLSGARSSETP